MKTILLLLAITGLASAKSQMDSISSEMVGKECELILDGAEEPLKKIYYTTRHDEILNYLVLILYTVDLSDSSGITPGVTIEDQEFGFYPNFKMAPQGDEIYSASNFLTVTENGLVYLEIRLDEKTGDLKAFKKLTERPGPQSGLIDRKSKWFDAINCVEKKIEVEEK